MNEYKIAAVIWNDHISVDRDSLPINPEDLIVRVISVGIILEETEEFVLLAHDIERYDNRDDSTYIVILRGTIKAIKIYGTIEIDGPTRG
jgi:hypothetical protein